MISKIPRIVLAGTNSGCGKTTVSCALMQALVNRGLKTAAFKCGPDYIDPMFHSRIIGTKSANLDSFFLNQNTLKYLLSQNASDREISVIEGVMGYYDGIRMDSFEASTYEIAQITESPVILVVGARGAALSVFALIQGFLDFAENSNIRGVILNQCTAMTYQMLASQIEKRFHGRIRPMGYLPPIPESTIESRHLGLITASEISDLKEKLHRLAEQAEKSIEIDHILQIAEAAPEVCCDEIVLPVFPEKIRIAVAKDKAFCFYYEDSLDALKKMGAELVAFSPMEDTQLPEDIQGIYLGGGYPELYREKLSKNKSMRRQIKAALQNHLPCIAECGGFMYLTEEIAGYPMVGFLKGKCYDTGKLCRFGYVTLTAEKENLLCKKGESISAHEFHYWDCDDSGNSFMAKKKSGKSWNCVHTDEFLYAGYPHFHFYANPQFAVNFYKACLKEKNQND